MIFYKKKIIDQYELNSLKSKAIFILFLLTIGQVIVSKLNNIDIFLSFIIFICTSFCLIKIFKKEIIIEHFIPSFIVLAYNLLMLSGPLFFKTILMQNLSSNLYLPHTSFATAIMFQLILLIVLLFYCSSKKLKSISISISDNFVTKLKGFEVPSLKFTYFLFALLLINRFILDVVDQGVNSFTEDGDIIMKILFAYHEFLYLPLIYLFYHFQNNNVSKLNINILIIIMIFLGFFIGFASNSRGAIFAIFIYLFFFHIFFKIFLYKNYLTVFNYLILILLLIIFLNTNLIMDKVLKNREFRSSYSALDLFKMSLSTKIEKDYYIANEYISRENYTNNRFLDRLILIKLFDKQLYFQKDFSESQKKEYTNFALKRLVTIFPQNWINVFDENFKKKQYQISNGSLVDRFYFGKDIGGLKNSGHNIAEIILIFNSSLVSLLFFAFIYLIVMILYDSLQKNEKQTITFSPIISVIVIKLLFITSSDTLLGVINFSTRNFIQIILLNFLLILVYIKFFKKNSL
tara:strand:- start:871 stop:2424 length:1554 start_codon:yes stop_codon:yes gene_type:complete